MGFPRQEHWSGLPFPSPGDLPDSGIKPLSAALQEDSLPTKPSGKSSAAISTVQFSSVAQSCPTLWSHEPQHTRSPCPSPTPGVYPKSCPLSRWCHPTISSSVIPFSSCLQSFSASGSFQMSQFFTSGGQSTGVSASTSVLPMNTQDWPPLGWTGWIYCVSIKLLCSSAFSNK